MKDLSSVATAQDLARAMDKLPVFPSVALQVLAELREEEVSLESIERLAARDQVLASSLIRVANSAIFGACREVCTLTGAIVRLGTEMAAQVIIAAAAKPLFASSPLRDLWRHSITTAAVCSQLAIRAVAIEPGEAVVLGLVHDIGRLVILALPGEYVAEHARITEASGCPIAADTLLCGRDHADLGADLMERWNFPAEFIEAVRQHHQPERADSRLAAMLYVAEHLTAASEDTPSAARLSHALNTISIPLSECLDLAQSSYRLDALLSAA